MLTRPVSLLLVTFASLAASQNAPEPPRFVLNTHWHGDHTGGNENLTSKGSVIVARDRVRERMTTEQSSELLQRRTPPFPPKALPVVTFNDSLADRSTASSRRSTACWSSPMTARGSSRATADWRTGRESPNTGRC
ncbi:MAG: MBL fold metallo-hydrolase [Steroidobacteraceae bacterium]